MIKRGIIVVLFVLFLVPLALAGDAQCDTKCKGVGYEFGTCWQNVPGQGWVGINDDTLCTAFIDDTCICGKTEKLSGQTLCTWLEKGKPALKFPTGLGYPYDCTCPQDIVNYYCDESGNVILECRNAASFDFLGFKHMPGGLHALFDDKLCKV